jgi:single-strand DNA-binding protein
MFFVQVAGNLGKDPETRFTPSGQKVTTFSIACNQRKGKEDITTWVRVTIWGDRFDKMVSFLKKGSSVIVCGKMNPPTTYVDKQGVTQVTVDVTAEMIEFSPFGKPQQDGQGQSQSSSQPSQDSYNDESQFQNSRQPYNANANTYASKSPGVAHGSSSHLEDDALPF